MIARRELSISRLEDVLADVDQLLAGYHRVGEWSLGQICNHLATALNNAIDLHGKLDPPTQPEDPRLAMVRMRFFRANRFPDGVAAPLPELVPGPGLDDHDEARALGLALARFQAADVPFAPHPRLGSMTKDDWTQFHCLHAAHHLGFAVPSRIG